MTKKFMLGIQGYSDSGATQGVGYNIAFEGNEADRGFQSADFKDWRKKVTEIVLRHRDDVFDAAGGEENARQLASEIIAASRAEGVVVADDGEVPAIQVSCIDAQNNKTGKKLDISFSATGDAPASIIATDYSVRRAQEISGDGKGGIGLPAKQTFKFIGRGVAF